MGTDCRGVVKQQAHNQGTKQDHNPAEGVEETVVATQVSFTANGAHQVTGQWDGDHLSGMQQDKHRHSRRQRPQPGKWCKRCSKRNYSKT